MSEPIVATTQYGDLKGTVSADNADHGELLTAIAAKAGMPKGYFPVGFQMSATGHRFHATVYAVDAQVAVTPDELTAHAKGRDDLPVFAFRSTIEPAAFLELLASTKRLSIVAQLRSISDVPMVELHNT